MNKTMHWRGIPVTVRRSRRANQVWLRMRAGKGVEVVLPYRAFAAEVPVILERHREWIDERLAEMTRRGDAPGQQLLPDSVALPFLGRKFRIQRETADRPGLRIDAVDLGLFLPRGDEESGVLLLQRWLIMTGKQALTPFCHAVAAEKGIAISGVTVRNQASRWGSCSATGGISLNAKLLFLTTELAHHVVLHELCHIAHRNHGPNFWAELQSLDPLTAVHEHQLH